MPFSRRRFGVLAAGLLAGEAGYAKRYLAGSKFPNHLTLLNSNENPDGPPAVSIEAMQRCLRLTGRYRDEDVEAFAVEIAEIEGVKPEEVVVGSGSSAILSAATVAFTSPKSPVIAPAPVFELPLDLAKSLRHPYVQTPLRKDYSADVQALAREANKHGGGLVYLCNPNNPTASITAAKDLDWLVANLPTKAILLLDEAYIHFDAALESGMKYVKAGRNVIVTRTFSKIYGMAGLRVGYACARKDLAQRMAEFRDPVISIPGVHAASAALQDASLVPKRRAQFDAIRKDFVAFLQKQGVAYIPSHANFIMFDIPKPAVAAIEAMKANGILVGRPFPPYDRKLRVSFGSEPEMARAKAALVRAVF